ncbi:CPBP family intramembrane glutamic endopeptidase [Metabacillus malikii]|uniref:Membrane protease YdiL (CAAX protease family) n=1 Tax=Metabacillus malikii TaxID=1504265 RepID=A0ABT9ZEK1_9BACI|nr:CPBP family intramembrane glutamic endopeptidase [Metabacillus malikii]MDQ0230654.1 membrane protease YdiL (CAAX protease family) [Metabacillus malikii]
MSIEISKSKRIAVLLTPPLIILIGYVTASIFSRFLNEWAWIPLALIYWTSLTCCIIYFKGEKRVKDWLKKSKPSKLSISLTLLFGLFPMSVLVMNYHLFDSAIIIILWIVFALVNPLFEELYWRGLLLDAAIKWFPKWISVGYSTLFFILSHPLMWGVFSIANNHYHVFITLFLLGIVWSVIYFKTESLRWAIFSHFLVDVGIMTVPVFLNIYVPPM